MKETVQLQHKTFQCWVIHKAAQQTEAYTLRNVPKMQDMNDKLGVIYRQFKYRGMFMYLHVIQKCSICACFNLA